MWRRIFVFSIALLLVAPARLPERLAADENPRCGTLQAQQAQLSRQVRNLKSDVVYWNKAIAEYRQDIIEAENRAVRAGFSRTGNVTNETRYYKGKIAEYEREVAAAKPQLQVTERQLAYVQGRQHTLNCTLSFDLSGEWTLTWTWSVTSVDFEGNVTGSPGNWHFTGTLSGGGNAVWSPHKGTGRVSCVLSGTMGGKGTMQCAATFSDPQPSSWTGTASGPIEAMSSHGKRNFEFTGRYGHGQSTGQPPAGLDLLQLQPKD